MPFGTMGIDGERDGKKKKRISWFKRKEKNDTVQPPYQPADNVKPEPFTPIDTNQNHEEQVSVNSDAYPMPDIPPYEAPEFRAMPDGRLDALIIGETLEIAEDFLCSMWQNTEDTLVKSGMACSLSEETMPVMSEIKIGIENCFNGLTTDIKWPVYKENAPSDCRLRFSIHKSGYPNKALEMNFICVTPDADISRYINQASAVWILVPGSISEHAETEYEGMIKQILLSYGEALKKRVVELIISQFENTEHYRDSEADAELSGSVRTGLYKECRRMYGEIFEQAGMTADMCQVQIYGGLELADRDEYGRPVFIPDGRYAGYNPVACHIPVLHTFSAIRNSGEGYLSLPAGEEIWHGIQTGFADYIGSNYWSPQKIG